MPFNLFSGDPQSQAMLAMTAGLLESGGPSRMPVGIGQGIARGMMDGRQAYMMAEEAKRRQAYLDMQRAQFDEAKQAAMQRQAAIAQLSQDPRFAGLQSLMAVDPGAAIKAAYPEAKVVAPGGSLVSPANPQVPLFNSPPKPPEGFKLKADGGLEPIPEYWKQKESLAAAGAARTIQNVNTFTPASEEAQKEQMKSIRTNYEALRNAPGTLRNIEEAKALIPAAKGFMGPGGEGLLEAAKFLNNRFGTKIDTEGVKSAEELRTRIFFQIMENLKKMDAQPSEMQQVMMRDALGKLGTDPNALGAVLDAYGSIIRDKVAVHNREVTGSIKSGVKFAYDPMIDIESPSKPSAPQPKPMRPKVVDFGSLK